MTARNGSKQREELAQKKIFTTGEAAELCNVSQQTIIRCFDNGRLQGFRVPGSRFRRIPREDLLRFMDENDIPSDVLTSGRKRVLLVDDDEQILEVFKEALERDERFEVQTAGTGYDAGMLTESFKPDLVVLDYMLPDVNGDLVCKRLRERESGPQTRVIFVSGVIEPGEIEKLKDAGADDFMQKPIDIQKLIDRIADLLSV
jgi:excisionase family DNA binding protein